MWPDGVSNPGPLTYKSGAVPTALRGLAISPVIAIFKLRMETRNELLYHKIEIHSSGLLFVNVFMHFQLCWGILQESLFLASVHLSSLLVETFSQSNSQTVWNVPFCGLIVSV